ncbi:hypothetical protein CTI12_AA281700 [Artemisia annua]|uniref:FAF domain-containing protein n=1 Tax=Artemisia annua TaxID=35608 RepID=A0A2U1ND90_ARTAN|nr:hypothetical protein CTI12_AA281700 [Artemisia annua]
MTQMQGIVSILDNPEKTTRAASLRRTLSADMSSKRWLADNGMPVTPTMKKISSSEHIASFSSSESDEECEMTGKGDQNPTRVDIWTAIMSQKKDDNSMKLPPPYVHPLVKKSASSLSEKSLKVCTESLGSETGSDVFSSSDTASDTSSDDQKQENKEELKEESDEQKVVKVACTLTTKKSQQARSFPPPLPSLAAAHTDGPSLHMHSRRVDGRLVLEAVSVPPQKYFEAQRQDGRFLLTLINNPEEQQTLEDKFVDERPLNTTTMVMNVHKSTIVIKKITERDNENPLWSGKQLNTKLEELVEEEEDLAPYFWRAKPTVASVIDPMITQHRPPTKTKDLVLLRGNKADCLLPSLIGCKEPRRSLLMWEPFCIAT